VLEHRLIVDHNNFKEYIESFETNAPKIHRLTKKTALCSGGDGSFSDVIQTLNPRKNIPKQILERLKKKHLTAFWFCHVATVRKGKPTLTSISYEAGEIKTEESVSDNITLNSFAPEMKDIFFGKYVMPFYIGTTGEKTKILQEFFDEIGKLYEGRAGGTPVIAKIDKDGFKWVTKAPRAHVQNFTGYGVKWMPQKIETMLSTELAWSSLDWTNILELSFECENKELVFALVHSAMHTYDVGYGYFRLLIDDNILPESQIELGRSDGSGTASFYGNYATNNVAILEKGSHILKVQMCTGVTGKTVYAKARRITILKGFYAGGAS
jgi:hypothetical protein